MKNDKNNDNNLYYLYFIENHQNDKDIELFLEKKENNNINSNYLELIYREEMKNISNISFDVSIYRFRIYPNNIKIEKKQKNPIIIVKLKDENQDKFESKISTKEFEENRNFFLFDFKFDSYKKLFKTYFPPKSFEISNRNKFIIFMKFLKENYKIKKDTKEIEDLIHYTMKIIDKDFFFYTNMFLNAMNIKNVAKNFYYYLMQKN